MRHYLIIGLALSAFAFYLWSDSRSAAVGEWYAINNNSEASNNLTIFKNGKALYYNNSCTWESVGNNHFLIECGKTGNHLTLIGEDKAELDGRNIYRKGPVLSEEVKKVLVTRAEEALSRARNETAAAEVPKQILNEEHIKILNDLYAPAAQNKNEDVPINNPPSN